MNEMQQKWGHDIEVGQAILKFAVARRIPKTNGWEPSGWIVPGGEIITNGDEAQFICARMAAMIGKNKPMFPRGSYISNVEKWLEVRQ